MSGEKIMNSNLPSERESSTELLRVSELSYRRLFEAARDGIFILNLDTGRITDVNPFLVELLGFSRDEMIGQTVGELSPFKDMESNQAMLERLQQHGYTRYEDLPLETRDGRKIAVEFVSNVYQAGDKKVIQCNIRDITERRRAESETQRLNADLERRVQLRTAQVDVLNRKLETINSSVSQVLRAPLH
jgi:PAS domain S-box-containing protein